MIETNIDDLSPEILGYAVELLLQSGAKDVWTEPIYMKKNRAAVKLCVICDEKQIIDITRLILKNTSSIGVRYRFCDRLIMNREIITVNTEYGDAKVKRCTFEDIQKDYVEYESAKALAENGKIPLDDLYRAIYKAIR